MKNYIFYSKSLKSHKQSKNASFRFIPIWKQLKNHKTFYQQLEKDHSYIQWLFPHYFKSQYNSDSYPLTAEEAAQMRSSKIIQSRLTNNFNMILRFFGISSDYQIIDEEQFKITCFIRLHNIMRLCRIVVSLSVLGQREQAEKLLEFLKDSFQKFGYQKYYQTYLQKYEADCDSDLYGVTSFN